MVEALSKAGSNQETENNGTAKSIVMSATRVGDHLAGSIISVLRLRCSDGGNR